MGIGDAFKAIVLDSNRSISNIYNISSIYLEGIILTNNQPNITNIGKLNNLTVNGIIDGVKRIIVDEIILNGTKIITSAKDINKFNKFTNKEKKELNINTNNISWSFIILVIIFAIILIEPTII